MLGWLFRMLVLLLFGAGFFHLAFLEAPDPGLSRAGGDLLAANLPGRDRGEPEIRVLIAESLDRAVLTINGRIAINAVGSDLRRHRGDFSQSVSVEVSPTGQGIRLGGDQYVRASLKSLDNQPLRLTWKSGNGETSLNLPREIEISGTHVAAEGKPSPRLRILTRLPIEEYLYGVVAGEIPGNWPLEAIRAQAVASRSFAYFSIRSRANEEYDVHADTRSQVWKPSPTAEPLVRRAVDSTAGVVLTEKNALIKTFFHSECGGFTADARWVFTKTPILALSGVGCPRCSNQKNNPTSWRATYSRQEIEARLRKAGLLKRPGEIRVLQGLDSRGNPMGRRLGRLVSVELTLAGDRGGNVRLPANDFRLAMGADRQNISSTYLSIEGGDQARITFSGYGWGHGVGLCQYGALYAADKLGYNFLDILGVYFPGAKPVRLWGSAPAGQ
ncbi:MAG: SpoIID/LytB domain-containing protein [Planctomycetota bacterium]|jgi:stage II sporulation protein D|nr:SpoIID/LytB domain-containing protein [Planctomycetota bacterium]